MALFTGLRRGELRALRWADVDLKGGVAHVRRSWDDLAGEQDPKTFGGESAQLR
jgi:integrase